MDREAQIKKAAKQLLPRVERARKLGCSFGLYNHGGWGGEPENLVAVCEYLRKNHDAQHVGIVYNQHHGHSHVGRFFQALAVMKPYLICLNLNGMAPDGDKRGMKILPLSEGEQDPALLKIIADSGYKGVIGIIGHTNHDVEKPELSPKTRSSQQTQSGIWRNYRASRLNGVGCDQTVERIAPLARSSSPFIERSASSGIWKGSSIISPTLGRGERSASSNGTSFAKGFRPREITMVSPRSTACKREERWVFASFVATTLIVPICKKVDQFNHLGREVCFPNSNRRQPPAGRR